MIALFSALMGLLGSAFPEFLKLVRDRSDRAHEIALLKLQIEYDRERLALQKDTAQVEYGYKLQEIAVNERAALNQGTGTRDGMLGIGWVDALSGTVRPVMTYSFFALYGLVKFCQFQLLVSPALPWQAGMDASQAVVSLWTEDDMGIFAAVVAFWFGSRALGKLRR